MPNPKTNKPSKNCTAPAVESDSSEKNKTMLHRDDMGEKITSNTVQWKMKPMACLVPKC